MMTSLGRVALLAALGFAVYTFLAGAGSLYLARGGRQNILDGWRSRTGQWAGIATFLAVTAAAFVLVRAIVRDDFSISYILHHSSRSLPFVYKLAALWSGQEGSLLLWAWLLSGYACVLHVRSKGNRQLLLYVTTILAAIQIFFLLLLNIAAPPFQRASGPLQDDGFGLSPLLQYPEMIIHPPVLYLGYVGFSVPFAFALGALMMRCPAEIWIPATRRWTLLAWLFLTCGIFLGAHWAYEVLGWGGYWAWDPVENASLMPWLTATAFLHAVMMYERRRMMKGASVWLIFATFLLTILGTLLTRLGIVSSVHAFARSAIGSWFWSFLLGASLVCVVVYVLRRQDVNDELRPESLVSRESSFFYNNLLLGAACFTVLWGTLIPVISDSIYGTHITVGPAFYSGVTLPIGICMVGLMGASPLLAWREATFRQTFCRLIGPAVAAACAGTVLLCYGFRPLQSQGSLFSFATWCLATLVVAGIAVEFFCGVRGVKKQTADSLLSSIAIQLKWNHRRYGGYIVHFGVAVIVSGVAGSALNRSAEQAVDLHQSMTVGAYRLECVNSSRDFNQSYDRDYVVFDVFRREEKIGQLVPEKRYYFASRQSSTIVANRSTLAADLYVVFAGRNPDTQQPIVKVQLNPLVAWIWIGAGIVSFGTVFSLVVGSRGRLIGAAMRR